MEPEIQDTEDHVANYSYLSQAIYQSYRFEWTTKNFNFLRDSLHTIEKSFFPQGTDNKYKWVFEVNVKELENEDMIHLQQDRLLEFNLKTNDINKYVEYSLILKSLSHVYKFDDCHEIADGNFVFRNSIYRRELKERLKWIGVNDSPRDLTIICKLRIADSFKDFQKEDAILEHDETENISDHKNSILIDDSFKDFTFVVQSQKFDVHKIILALESPVFAAMFKSEMREGLSFTANIDNIEPDIFEKMIQFIYHQKIDHADLEKSAPKFLQIAHMYDLRKLRKICAIFLYEKLCVDNVVETLSLADVYSISALKVKALKIIKLNFKMLKESEEFKNLIKEKPNVATDLVEIELKDICRNDEGAVYSVIGDTKYEMRDFTYYTFSPQDFGL